MNLAQLTIKSRGVRLTCACCRFPIPVSMASYVDTDAPDRIAYCETCTELLKEEEINCSRCKTKEGRIENVPNNPELNLCRQCWKAYMLYKLSLDRNFIVTPFPSNTTLRKIR